MISSTELAAQRIKQAHERYAPGHILHITRNIEEEGSFTDHFTANHLWLATASYYADTDTLIIKVNNVAVSKN